LRLTFLVSEVAMALMMRFHFTEKHHTRPHRHPGNAYLVILKVSVTNTYANENEERPEGFARGI